MVSGQPKERNLGFFAGFMQAYGRASQPSRAELYMDTRAYSGGKETAATLYMQVRDLLGVAPPSGEVVTPLSGTAA